MRTFLDVRRVVDALIDRRQDRIRGLAAVVEVEDGLQCSDTVSETTVADVFGQLLDHLLEPDTSAGRRIQIGWLPTSDATRVFFLTNSGIATDDRRPPKVLPTSTDHAMNGVVREARERVEGQGGRLWIEEGAGGGLTFFVLFGSPPQPSYVDHRAAANPTAR